MDETKDRNDSTGNETEATIKKGELIHTLGSVLREIVRITLPTETECASILKRRRSMQNLVHEIFVKLR